MVIRPLSGLPSNKVRVCRYSSDMAMMGGLEENRDDCFPLTTELMRKMKFPTALLSAEICYCNSRDLCNNGDVIYASLILIISLYLGIMVYVY